MEVAPPQASNFIANFVLNRRICFSNIQRATQTIRLPAHANVWMSVTELTYGEKPAGRAVGRADRLCLELR